MPSDIISIFLSFDRVLFYLQKGYNYTGIKSALYMMSTNDQNFKCVERCQISVKIVLLLNDLLNG